MNRYGIIKILKASLIIVISLTIISYAYFAFRDYMNGPSLILIEPINGNTISTSTVILSGRVLRVKDIMLNGRPLLIDKEGNFTETLLLHPGYNISLLSAIDKFNRTIEYKLELVYNEDSTNVVE